jgi:acyl carrier protein
LTEETATAAIHTADEIRAKIVAELCELADLEPERIKPEATLQELDIDSLDLVELGQIIEETYGVQLDRDDMKDVVTVGQALDIIVDRCVAAAV